RVLEFKSKKQLLEIADDIVFVFAQTLSDHAGNYELSANELAFLKNSLVQIADPRLIKIITYKDKVIGFLFGFHDLSAAMQRAGGKLNLWSTFRLLREYKKADRILINGMGILPDFQGTGANTLLYAEIEKTIRQYTQFKHLEMVQIQETTAKMLSNVETLEGEILKTHRVYQLKF
nr:GNAT family N-acetyltransferase [Candidatus Saccharibacteria bacterium]